MFFKNVNLVCENDKLFKYLTRENNKEMKR